MIRLSSLHFRLSAFLASFQMFDLLIIHGRSLFDLDFFPILVDGVPVENDSSKSFKLFRMLSHTDLLHS